jgi:1,4-dihydroxy-2-naphthoate octaprenyltransferase
VFLGASSAVATTSPDIDWRLFMFALLGGVLAHISVNTLNEYQDFKSGLDLQTSPTPFSGGSGALPQYPKMARSVFWMGVASLVALIAVGLYLAAECGPAIVPIGILGAILVVSYTGWINRYPVLCLFAPGAGFGLLMVTGTQYVLLGKFVTLSFVAAAVPFFLVNNLLLLNQFPDIEADREAGRRHFPIVYGVTASSVVYALFSLATIVVIVVGVAIEQLPPYSIFALLPMPLSLYSLYGAIRHGGGIGLYSSYLAANVAVTLSVPTVLGVSLVVV